MQPWGRLRDLIDSSAHRAARESDDDRPLTTVTMLLSVQTAVGREMDLAIVAARDAGASFPAIGRALGNRSKQAGTQRYVDAVRRLADNEPR